MSDEFVAACRDGNLEHVRACVEGGVDPNSNNIAGTTGLELASNGGHAEIVVYLLEAGASPNREGDAPHTTALMHAATKGIGGLVKTLCDHGADLDAIDDGNKQTALMWACAYGRSVDVVRILLEHGADRSICDIYGNDALRLAEHFGFDEIADLLRRSD